MYNTQGNQRAAESFQKTLRHCPPERLVDHMVKRYVGYLRPRLPQLFHIIPDIDTKS
jgi:hypothetical protein